MPANTGDNVFSLFFLGKRGHRHRSYAVGTRQQALEEYHLQNSRLEDNSKLQQLFLASARLPANLRTEAFLQEYY